MFDEVFERLASRFGPSKVVDALAELLPDFASALANFTGFIIVWKVADRVVRKSRRSAGHARRLSSQH